ncbi:uncharacterized protein CDV56_106971 [Aspergillus thermomutatus]|uniref:Methylitaconate delta2-delta3-isomerase n=1 Tax=Aspergillus thermomutatus TaxID=41047 RepID=A0A397GVZ4_ASPTH|nr:uncharacterized protein CDV56_106971 [Aspergillus thermomutatus]RHZ53586.1 hypothetical protein CDV56_106971 [Aspergillus thermomutatus]
MSPACAIPPVEYSPAKAPLLQPLEYTHLSSRKTLPAVWMRAGTSKGLFLHRRHLPASTHLWEPILLSAMGSSQGDGRQIDGVGGASSTTSKVAVVEGSSRPDVDVEYTFVQVAPDQPRIDMTGNCGNIASGVGPFSLDEGIVRAAPGQKEIDIRTYNTNTGQHIVETVQVAADGSFQEEGECRIPGVAGASSPIRLAFLSPGGSMTGQLFPSGAQQETLTVQSRTVGTFDVRVSLVDAANPFVLVDAASLPMPLPPYTISPTGDSNSNPNNPAFLSVVEDIRREGAVRFGLAADPQAAGKVRGTPKIALLSSAAENDEADIRVLAFTMGKPHASLQLTGAVCVGAATVIHGTIAWELARKGKRGTRPKHGMSVGHHQIAPPLPVGIRHPAGVIPVEAVLGMDHKGEVSVDNVAVFRTARRLFEGNVYYHV